MSLIDIKELSKSMPIKGAVGEIVAKFLMQLMKLNKLNKCYNSSKSNDPITFIDSVLKTIDVNFVVPESDLKRIPKDGPFITVSNHPYGGIDGLLLIKLLLEHRPDYKVMANFMLQKIEPLENVFFSVNPFENNKTVSSSFLGLKNAIKHLKCGFPLGIFPAGEVSSYQTGFKNICDKQWLPQALKFIKSAEVPIVPVYFEGTNSRMFHILGKIHPILRTVKLPSELFNKKNKTIKIRIGLPLLPKEQDKYTELDTFGRYLRAKTYALGTKHEVKNFYRQIKFKKTKKAEPIIDEQPVDLLKKEIETVKKEFELYQSRNFSVIYAPSSKIPNLLTEIGRLREITFREVGEGTNLSCDLDEYDFYYDQLVIWDNEASKIVGAYRIGKGDEILSTYGRRGFYLNSLFKIKKGFYPYLNQSIELGRSFISKEYQRKPLSLFLLWKGILYFLLKNPKYRYLIGPVSISNDFSKFSKELIVEFCRQNLFNHEVASFIKPKKQFKIKDNRKIDKSVFLEAENLSLEKLDNIIQNVDPGLKSPVLLKKYIKLNAKLIAFNIDPKFNNCLDGFIMVDILNVPHDIIKSLSKELEESSVTERVKNDGTFSAN